MTDANNRNARGRTIESVDHAIGTDPEASYSPPFRGEGATHERIGAQAIDSLEYAHTVPVG
jgi:hypothetical protein